MKKNYELIVILFLFCFLLPLISCDKEDDGIKDENSLIGTWVLTSIHGYEIEDGERSDLDGTYSISNQFDVIELDADGTCHNYSPVIINGRPDYDWNEYGGWFLKGNKLSLLFCDFEETVSVSKLTSSILIFDANIQEEGYQMKATFTYQKID